MGLDMIPEYSNLIVIDKNINHPRQSKTFKLKTKDFVLFVKKISVFVGKLFV